MLGYEYERMFDTTLKKVLPYLILPPNEFRNDLADRMAGLFHFLRGDNSEVMFIDLNKKINEIIDPDKRESWDSSIEIEIHDFNGRQISFDDRIRKINERLTKLENTIKEKKKGKKVSAIIEKEKEISAIMEKKKDISAIMEKEKEISPIIEREISKPLISESEMLELLKNLLKTNDGRLKINGRITNPEVRVICDVNIDKAKRLLQQLIKENIVKQIGKKKGTYYERI